MLMGHALPFDGDQAGKPRLVCSTNMRHGVLWRFIGPALIVGGGLLMWLSPETLGGAMLLGAGIALELLGLALRHG